jgi:hypothetical protein
MSMRCQPYNEMPQDGYVALLIVLDTLNAIESDFKDAEGGSEAFDIVDDWVGNYHYAKRTVDAPCVKLTPNN